MGLDGFASAPTISIHAAREGGDAHRRFHPFERFLISIHAAREGGDAVFAAVVNCNHISIHAAREGGDAFDGRRLGRYDISIHAAREGGDCCLFKCFWDYIYFNPRRP